MTKLKVKRDFILRGKPVQTGDAVVVAEPLADYLLGLADPPVEKDKPLRAKVKKNES